MAEDHGAPEVEQFSRTCTRGCRVTESRKVRGRAVHHEIRSVLGRMTAGIARRILDSSDKSSEGCVCCSKNEGGHSESDKRAQVP